MHQDIPGIISQAINKLNSIHQATLNMSIAGYNITLVNFSEIINSSGTNVTIMDSGTVTNNLVLTIANMALPTATCQ